jgi:hypothetical protein
MSSADSFERLELAAADCEALVKVVALKVALASNPVTVARAKPPIATDERRRRRESVAPALPMAPREVSFGESVRDDWRIAARISGGSGFGILPRTTPAVALVGSLQFMGLRFELGTVYWFPGEVRYDEPPDIGAKIELWTALIRTCPVAALWTLEMPLCLGIQAGAMRGQGFGASGARASTRARLAVALGPALVIPIHGRFSLHAELDAVLVLVRPAFRVRNLGRLYHSDRAGIQGFFGIEMALD